MTRRTSKMNAGFTLVELLVVMAIIAILMGLLVPTINAVRTYLLKVRTEATIQGLSTALDQYKLVYHAYPPDQHPSLDLSSESLVYYLSGGGLYWTSSSPAAYRWRHPIYNTTDDDAGRKSLPHFMQFRGRTLQDTDGDMAPELMDPWQKNFIYNAGTSIDGSYNQFGAPKHLVGRFDLFSAGPDKRYGQAAEADRDDNVNNWDDDNPAGWGYTEFTLQ